MTRAVFAAGGPAPEVLGEVTLDGRFGIVLVRVVKSLPLSSQGIDENDVMLDPWVELPMPKTAGKPFRARPGKMPSMMTSASDGVA